VTVDVGPSFASKRQEAAASMLDFTRSVPQVAQAAADLIARNMDWPGAQEIADRLKKMLPPGLADDGKGKQQLPPEAQAKMQHMGQMIDQLTQHLNEANHTLETKKLELESRERIEFAKMQTNAEIEMAKMGSAESMALLKHEIAEIGQRLQMVDFYQPIETQFQNSGQPQAAPGAPNMGQMPMQGMPGAPPPQAAPQDPTGGASPGQPLE
jgi:hypothetical protein